MEMSGRLRASAVGAGAALTRLAHEGKMLLVVVLGLGGCHHDNMCIAQSKDSDLPQLSNSPEWEEGAIIW